MPLINDPLAKVMKHVLGYSSIRHDAIASNIANPSTPGYKAFDVVLRERVGGGKELTPRTSHPRHMAMGVGGTERTGAEIVRSKAPAKLDGNNVNLDVELMKMLENRVLYQASMELMDRWGALKPYAREVK